jgi:hypothetical protein
VFALIAATISRFGIEVLQTLAIYVVVVALGLALHAFVTYGTLVAVLVRLNPVEFFRRMGPFRFDNVHAAGAQRAAKGLLMGWLDAIVGLGFGSIKGVMILTVLLFLLAHLPLAEPIRTQLRTSAGVEYLELFNPFLERSVQAYRRLGGERLWEQFRAPEANRPPAMGEGRRAGDAFMR